MSGIFSANTALIKQNKRCKYKSLKLNAKIAQNYLSVDEINEILLRDKIDSNQEGSKE